MTNKDRVIQTVDHLADALKILSRIDYNNPEQTVRNMEAAWVKLDYAASVLLTSFSKKG